MKELPTILDATVEYQTKVYCIISDQRVFRSRSPQMFTTVLGKAGMNGAYVPFMVDAGRLGQALESLRVLHIAGANITAPFKEAVLPYLDVLSEGANIIGAVNTIVCRSGQLKGYNTNAIGVMDALNAAKFDIAGKRALVIGTGGAARAVAFILNWLRAASVAVAGRDPIKTRRLADQFCGSPKQLHDLTAGRLDVDIVVNATSISSRSESAEMTAVAAAMRSDACQLVFDLNYGHTENIWRDMAARSGLPFMDGLAALAYQARRTFLLWTGLELPQETFLNALGV